MGSFVRPVMDWTYFICFQVNIRWNGL